jgi:hypothetical protein
MWELHYSTATGSFVGVVYMFPFSSSLLTECLVIWNFSNGGLGSLPSGSARFDDCYQVVKHFSSLLSAIHAGRYKAAFLSEADGDSSWSEPCFGRLVCISDFRRLTQGYIH